MLRKLIISIVLLTVSFSFAQTSTIRVGQTFTVDYPNSFVRTYDLNESASLQMINLALGKFSIIIQDEKASLDHFKIKFGNLEEALDFYIKNLVASMEEGSTKKSGLKTLKINNYNTIEMELEGALKDEETSELSKIFYHFSIVETPNYYYQILSWSSQENKSKYIEEFRKIAGSFKEVN